MQRPQQPLTNAQIEELDQLLASIHAPLQPMDASALDGYLCGVLLQPVTISLEDWLPLVLDVDGQPVPGSITTARIADMASCRLGELRQLVQARQWFDPWIFETDDDSASPVSAQLPWVAGFAAAMERFPALMAMEDPALLEPLAVLYAAFDPEDLEEAEELLPIIETLQPPQTLEEAAEDLVRSVLLLADVSQPRAMTHPPGRRHGGPPRRGQAPGRSHRR
ncbi:MAG: YecA family protein [Rubrivivax sp.]|nr:YecA family protein [Rubrivivax sp.]